jgi:hypothetical protein
MQSTGKATKDVLRNSVRKDHNGQVTSKKESLEKWQSFRCKVAVQPGQPRVLAASLSGEANPWHFFLSVKHRLGIKDNRGLNPHPSNTQGVRPCRNFRLDS